ncbi:MAG: TIGR00266 family protein [Planctomycetota bacterium]
MNYEIICSPAYSALEATLDAGEPLVAESGAMAWMSANIRTETSTRGGFMSGMKRKMLAGESFFQNTYRAEGGPGSVALAPGAAGDIIAHELHGDELLLEKGAYLASTEHVTCDSKWGGLRGLFNEGMFVLRVSGTGTLFFNAYGDVHPVDVEGEYVVDNGFAVAWEPSLDYQVTRGKKIRSFLFSDQLLLRFSGSGRIWVQSRNPRALASWVHPFRPVESNND